MTLREAFEKHGRSAKLRRPDWVKGHWVWWHAADACLYRQSGLLNAFAGVSVDDQIADDWEIVKESPKC